MKTLSNVGWFTLILGLLMGFAVYWHFNGLNDLTYAIGHMLSALFYGGILWFGVFCTIMALLFLNK